MQKDITKMRNIIWKLHAKMWLTSVNKINLHIFNSVQATKLNIFDSVWKLKLHIFNSFDKIVCKEAASCEKRNVSKTYWMEKLKKH